MIPSYGELLIKSGQKVDFTTPFVRSSQARRVALPVSAMMKSSPNNIFRMIKKGMGDSVGKGDLLAEQKSLFATKQYFSDVQGTIVHIDHEHGTVTIEEKTGNNDTLNCFFTGEVVDIDPQKITLKVQKSHPIALATKARHNGGSVYYLKDTATEYTEDDIVNSYVIAETIDQIQLAKLETLGAHGIILPKKHHGSDALDNLILQDEQDYQHLMTHQFPYVLVDPSLDTLIFYS